MLRQAAMTASARQASVPAEAATGVDVLITMLTDGPAVERVMDGPEGALSKLASDAIWIHDEHGWSRLDRPPGRPGSPAPHRVR